MIAPQLLPRIEPSERARFFLASLAFMCVAAAALVARTAGDALFLSELGSAPLPFMYIAGAVATGLGAYACARAAGRLTTARVAIMVSAILLAANALVFLLLDLVPASSRVAAYVLADIAGRLPPLLFWALASEIFDAGASRRLFGLIGAAGTAACLPAGLAMGPLARALGTGTLLLAVCVLMAGATLCLAALRRHGADRSPSLAAGRGALIAASAQSSSHLHRNRQFLAIAIFAAVSAVLQTLVDYQFKMAYAPLSRSESLAGVFGDLYALTSTVALFLQLFLVHRIIRRSGVFLTLAILPAGVLAASLGALKFGTASWVFAVKAVDVTLTMTLFGTARQLLYRGIRSESRLQARALAEGVYQPLALGLTGAMLAATIGHFSIRIAAGVTILGCLLWILATRSACTSYLAGLISSIRNLRYEADHEPWAGREPAVEAYIRKELAGSTDEEMIYLAGILPDLGEFGPLPELVAALNRKSPRVKTAILDCLRRTGPLQDLSVLEPLAAHDDPEVRRAAIRAASASGCGPGPGWLEGSLEDPEPVVRAAAAAALLNLPDRDGEGEASSILKMLVESGSIRDRGAAAAALRDVRDRSVSRLLRPLLEDQEPAVRLAALETSTHRPDRDLVPGLLSCLESARTARSAAAAIVAVGAEALGPIAALVDARPLSGSASWLQKIPPILARIAHPGGLALLERILTRLRPFERKSVYCAYARLVKSQPDRRPHLPDLDRLIIRESRSARARMLTLRKLGASRDAELVRDAVSDLFHGHLRNAFELLDARFDGFDLLALHARLLDADRESRSQARELLENLLPDPLKSPLLEVLDWRALGIPGRGSDPRGAINSLLMDLDSEWVVAGALQAASAAGDRSLAGQVRRHLAHPSPVVRETALAVMADLAEPAGLLEVCLPLTRDGDARVRDLACSLIRAHGSRD